MTLIEMIIVCSIIIMIVTLVTIYTDPAGKRKKARDEKRLSDVLTIDRAINEFVLDHKRYPDQSNILRKSTILPSGSVHISNSDKGWIFENLSSYIPMLPVDPINDETYYYSYFRNSVGYELNAKLEILVEEMINDGGNDPEYYEIGNNLNLTPQ